MRAHATSRRREVERGRRWLRVNCASAVAGAEHVLAVSSVLRDRLVERYGLDPRRSTVVPCVADRDKFHLDERERAAVRRELGLEDRFVVVYPGRFGRWHYTPETFAVVRGLMDADAKVHLLVLTPDLEAATALAAETLPAGSLHDPLGAPITRCRAICGRPTSASCCAHPIR